MEATFQYNTIKRGEKFEPIWARAKEWNQGGVVSLSIKYAKKIDDIAILRPFSKLKDFLLQYNVYVIECLSILCPACAMPQSFSNK